MSLASNTRHPIHQKMVTFGVHHHLAVLQATESNFAVFHASLALSVLQTNKELTPQIEYQNPLADQFISHTHAFDKCEKFRTGNGLFLSEGIFCMFLFCH
jgi:hypothetical protein